MRFLDKDFQKKFLQVQARRFCIRAFCSGLLLLFSFSSTFGQKRFPNFENKEALVNPKKFSGELSKTYQLIVYAALGCSISAFLIDELADFQHADFVDVVIIEWDEPEAIRHHMEDKPNEYPIWSNTVLKAKMRRKKAFPQYMIYKNHELIYHNLGANAYSMDNLNLIFKRLKEAESAKGD
jgi:hypothetical protein